MKNEIKKIILNGNDEIVEVEKVNETTGKKDIIQKKIYILKGIVVLRENNVKSYGYKKENDSSLLKIYSNLIEELREQNKDKVKDLIEQELVNKLYSLGKIEYNNKKIITKITNYLDSEENPIKFNVNYTDGQDEIKVDDCYDENDYILKFRDKLVEMCNTYNIELDSEDDITDEFIQNLQNMNLLETKQVEKVIDNNEANQIITKKNELEDFKIKNFSLNRKLIASLVAAGVIGLVLSTHGCHKKVNKSSDVEDIKDNYAEEKTDYMYKEEMPIVETLDYFKEIAFLNMDNYDDINSDNIILENMYSQTYSNYTSKEDLIAIRNKNMSSIANYIQSNIPITDNANYIYYENLFNDDIKDKAYVKYFSMIGNKIIKEAYKNKQYIEILEESVKSAEEVVRLINNNEPLEVYICGEKQCIQYSELSREGKEMVLNIAWTNNLPLTNTTTYNGHTQDDISDIILNQASELGMIK